MYRLLSYPLNAKTPLYGDTEAVGITTRTKPAGSGSMVTTARLSLSNHSGTHIDAPRHFFQDGRSVSDLDMNELVFGSPLLIDCSKKEDELVCPGDIKGVGKCDLLLIRTGFYRFRGSPAYRTNNPGIAPETAEWIRKNRPEIRAVGIDAISVSAFQKRDLGRITHRTFLGSKKGYKGEPVLLIEDLDLAGSFEGLKKIFAVPIFIEDIDAMTCTVFGEFEGE